MGAINEAPKPDAQQKQIASDEQKAIQRYGSRITKNAMRQCWSPQEARAVAEWDE